MSKEVLLLVVGVLVFVSPLIGVPAAWKDIALFTLGGITLLIAVACRLQKRRQLRSAEDTLHVERQPASLDAHDSETTPV